jgi:inorganic pyrophosphatase/exopolyphosphatase
MKIIVTSGNANIDIDGLASALAYNELLKKEGKDSLVVLPDSFTQTVTKEIREWGLNFLTETNVNGASFVIVDVSYPKFIPGFVDQRKIIELYDHHPGFEDYWKKRLGDKAKIEMIGACATLIWEEYKRRQQAQRISSLSANLLYTAILSNTLNFQVSITNSRDINAAEEIKRFTKLPLDWLEKYYQRVEDDVNTNPKKAVQDMAVQNLPNLRTDLTIVQLELWDSKKFINKHFDVLKKSLTRLENDKWMLTAPSISEGKNYIYTENEVVKEWLRKILTIKFKGKLGITNRLWLRKEIWKKLQEL